MNVLVLGSGGREHTLTWKIKQSKRVNKIFVAPGNAGTATIAENVEIGVNDFDKIGQFALENDIKLIVVGPEDPLVNGISDYFSTTESLKNILVFGPNKEGAQLEGSKDFSKEFMIKHNIPTAAYKAFTQDNLAEGMDFLDSVDGPYVLKADGLAAGKGVIITESRDEAKTTLKEMIVDAKFGTASSKVVIEEFLSGIELSVFVITDGKDYVLLPEAKDYKRIGEGDKGLNTGGMGALSPVPFANEDFMAKVKSRIIEPTLKGLQKDKISFTGFIFFGLIKVNGEPEVIEYNVRMGDPETEVVIPRIKSDIVELLVAACEGKLAGKTLEISDEAAATVMLVSGGYPETYEKGKEISGLDQVENVLPFHAGTKFEGNKVLTNGGRVIAVTALGTDIFDALAKSNKAAETIQWDGKNYRTDIGFDLKTLV